MNDSIDLKYSGLVTEKDKMIMSTSCPCNLSTVSIKGILSMYKFLSSIYLKAFLMQVTCLRNGVTTAISFGFTPDSNASNRMLAANSAS